MTDMTNPTRRLTVGLGARSYDIQIGPGLLDSLAAALQPFLKRPRVLVISDETVSGLYRARVEADLQAAGLEVGWVAVPAGEASKSYACFAQVCDAALAFGMERSDLIVAFGGGVVGDLAGYVAASLLRGLDFVQVPTSLLAQVDSSVGGKTGINSPHGKNLVGAFHQPKAVLIDIDLLKTLSDRELRAGFAEVIKYGLIDQPDFYDWLEANFDRVLARDPEALSHAIYRSCQAKADTVAADETEKGRRALLNLGHTFAHALEAEAGYDGRLLHGEAVAIGLGMAHDLSARLGLIDPQDVARVQGFVAKAGLPTSPAYPSNQAPSVARMITHMRKDKKASAGQMTFIVTRALGQAFQSRDVPLDVLTETLLAAGCPDSA